MISMEKIARINELARKKKAEGLSPEETREQAALRREYIDAVKKNTRAHLKRIRFVEVMTEEELKAVRKEKN